MSWGRLRLLLNPIIPRCMQRAPLNGVSRGGEHSPWSRTGLISRTRHTRIFSRQRVGGPSGRRSAAVRGFTLIEVVLALAIFALMGGILYGAFSLGHSAVEKSEANSTRNQKQRAIADLLGNYIRSTFPYKESAQDQAVFFAGESDGLTFVSAYSQAMGGRGMAMIHLSKEERGDDHGEALRIEETAPVRVSEENALPGQSLGVTFEGDMRAVRFAYLDPQAEDDNWEDRWDGRERHMLPRAVGISFLNAHGEESRWIFPLMMTVLAP